MSWIIIISIIIGVILISIGSYFLWKNLNKSSKDSSLTQEKTISFECKDIEKDNDISNYKIDETPILGSKLLSMIIRTVSQMIQTFIPNSFVEFFALDSNTFTSTSGLDTIKFYQKGSIKSGLPSTQLNNPINGGASCPTYPSNVYVLAPPSNAICKTGDTNLYNIPTDTLVNCSTLQSDGFYYKTANLYPEDSIKLYPAINGLTCTQQNTSTKLIKCAPIKAVCKTLDSDLYGPSDSTSICNISKYDGLYKNGILNSESAIVQYPSINGGTTCTSQLPLNKVVKCSTLIAFVPTNLFLNLDANSYPGSGVTWSDLSGNGKNATLTNSPVYNTTQGGYFHFTDTSFQSAYIPSSLVTSLPKWTIEVWYRITKSLSGRYTALVTNQYDGTTKLNYSIGTNYGPATNYNISGGFFDGAWRMTSGFAPALTTWYQSVVTYDGTTLSQYTNGVIQNSLNYSGVPSNGGEIRIARRWDDIAVSSNYLDCDISIIRLYSVGLTSAQVLQNYNGVKIRYGLP